MDRTSCLIGKLYQAIKRPETNGIKQRVLPLMTPHPRRPNWTLLCIAAVTLSAQGCTNVKLPKTAFSKHNRQYQGVDSSYDGGQTYASEQVYQAVRQAKAENGVVLQVIGDDSPARVLPLPPGTRSVYVSELLSQTGVQEKLDNIEATLFRSSTDSIGGIPMEVKMSDDGEFVRPESDYSLQAGDRLMVSKAANPAMQALFNAVLGF